MRNPYPKELCGIKTDEQLVQLIPHPATRTAVAWYLMGKGYDIAVMDMEREMGENKTDAPD